MKIVLQLSNDQILMTFKILEQIENAEPTTVAAEKLIRSIVLEAYDKFATLKKKIVKQADLFDQKKKTKVSLKYYEAYGIEKMIATNIFKVNNKYVENILEKMLNELRQKLA